MNSIPPFPDFAGVEFKQLSEDPRLIVGTDGSVWSCKAPGKGYDAYAPWKKLKACPLQSGHMVICVHRGNGGSRYVHRLVAETFLGPPPTPKAFVLHKNDDPGDNRLDNLYWGSRQNNADDAVRNGKIAKGEDAGRAKLKEDDVRKIMALSKSGWTQKAIAAEYGIHLMNVQAILYGRSWNHVTGLPKKIYQGANANAGHRAKSPPETQSDHNT